VAARLALGETAATRLLALHVNGGIFAPKRQPPHEMPRSSPELPAGATPLNRSEEMFEDTTTDPALADDRNFYQAEL
jgi:hypothetical protein